ncbi:hypothetical protein CYK62_00870 [Clostridium perfringens]|uniref:hypothetical protein n=1 Tax=Clostridium perfringens TaxID=1502 RepID=UPI000D7127AF|nr:hypothetical protein [Clostridium perfringens]MBO3319848.1 hypothetical protein [Clostridium perfringens]MDT9337293.1 hypothetical protein [Clostridium perfringens]MDT9345049.1 hypothetical protein [Clostridium perfringens]MDT9348207.1 hypothetical protein [Clostridium perfringens]MDT9354136.1 hypothetical protein [Clostridium perfringens]
MNAKCISLSYKESDFNISQGIKGGGVYGKSYYKKGKIHHEQGFGWEKQITPSRLILTVKIEDSYYEIWVDRFFKDTIGKLTKNRREKLFQSMPEIINVERFEKNNGDVYYIADENDLYKWKDAAGL